jgi:CRP/FNR family transcriptional regulator, cyclic AMP receptor protein
VTTIALLDADADLAEAVDGEDLVNARSALIAPTIELEPGPWEPVALPAAAVGVLVMDGAILREVVAGEVVAMELLGPGDVLVPTADDTIGDFVDAEVRWQTLLPSQLALLRPDLVQRLSDWPGVLGVIFRRMAERSARQSVMQAICHNPRVDARLRGLFWHLAERWGRVTASGVVLPLRLTHDSLARLVGAQRPTVSTALKSLQDAGEVTRRRDGAWVLLPESQERLRRLQERVAAVRGAIELIESPNAEQVTAREHLARLQIAWEKNSASFMTLRKRMAELREETKGLSGGVRRFGSNGGERDGAPPGGFPDGEGDSP